jgi:hypothetical protein
VSYCETVESRDCRCYCNFRHIKRSAQHHHNCANSVSSYMPAAYGTSHELTGHSISSYPKGKAHPLQAMQAQRCLGELGLLDFLTSALYGGRLSASRTGRLYPPGHLWYSFSRGAESTPGPWFSLKEVTRPGIDPGTVLLAAQRLNHYATPGPLFVSCHIKFQAHFLFNTKQLVLKFYLISMRTEL